jgi:hypothetical protein
MANDLDAILDKPVEPTKPEERKKPEYQSKDGFEIGWYVIRGFTEIENVVDFLNDNYDTGKVFICGGYVRYMCSPRRIPTVASDVDIYCMDEKTFNAVKNDLATAPVHKLEIRHENEMAITYKRPENMSHPFFASPPIQLIKPIKEGKVVATGTMEEVLSNFDFTVIRCGLNPSGRTAVVDADFPHDEEKRILRLKNIHCPVSSVLRCMKYAMKGYWLPPFQAFRLFLDWDQRDDAYKVRMLEFLELAEGGEGLTQTEINELEALMRID